MICDAEVYASPNPNLQALYMESKWSSYSRADPAVPRLAQEQTLQDMNVIGKPSYDATHTTRRNLGHPADHVFAHSVGLIKDWARWFIPDATEISSILQTENQFQALVNSVWPNWVEVSDEWLQNYRSNPASKLVDDMASTQGAGAFLAENRNRPLGCRMPELRFCTQDIDCTRDSFGLAKLKCLLNYNRIGQDGFFDVSILDRKNSSGTKDQLYGICAEQGTCYQHKHCEEEEEKSMCMEDGFCGAPELLFTNKLNSAVNIQIFSSECSVDTSRVSVSEAIPDFAQANGMCSFRNWYHYLNDSQAARLTNGVLLEQADKILHRSNAVAGVDVRTMSTMSKANILMPRVDGCDMSYQHTEYKACGKNDLTTLMQDAFLTYQSEPVTAEEMRVSRPWKQTEQGWVVQYCNMPSRALNGFLAPYSAHDTNGLTSETLRLASSQIFRCKNSKQCPAQRFLVRGEAVENRKVQIILYNRGTMQVETRKYRDYCSLDSQRCYAAGQLIGADCVEITAGVAFSPGYCAVDHMTLPLYQIVFGKHPMLAEEEQDQQRLDKLREHCSAAFTQYIDNRKDVALFTFMKIRLSQEQPYHWSKEKSEVLQVQKYANALLFAVFGLNENGLGRGFETLDQYLQKTKCLAFVAHQMSLHVQQLQEAQELIYTPRSQTTFASEFSSDCTSSSTNSNGQAADQGVIMSEITRLPGNSLYIFLQRSAVYMPLRWFSQCVLLAKNAAEGGVKENWIKMLFDQSLLADTYEDFETDLLLGCQNYNINWLEVDTAEVTLAKRLRAERNILTIEDTELSNGMQVMNDIENTVSFALSELGIMSDPNLQCIQITESTTIGDSVKNLLETSLESEHLLRTTLPSLAALGPTVAYANALFAANKNAQNIYHSVYEFLSCDTMPGLSYATDLRAEWMQLTLQQLYNYNIIQLRSKNLNEVKVAVGAESKARFPLYEFANLRNLESLWQKFEQDGELCALKMHKTLSVQEYVYDEARDCSCAGYNFAPEQPPGCCKNSGNLNCTEETRKQLKFAEFAATRLGCNDASCKFHVPLLSKQILQTENLLARMNMKQPFLRYFEALKLILLLVREAFHNTIVGGAQALHISTDDYWKPLHALYAEPPIGNTDDVLSIEAAMQYNRFMQEYDDIGIECQANTGVKMDVETNPNNMRLRECSKAIKETVGWKLGTQKNQVLRVPVSRKVLLSGFYPSFLAEATPAQQTPNPLTARNFLSNLFSCAQAQQDPICYSIMEDILAINPFWAEYFDVAADTTQSDSVSLGCDIKRSGKDNTLFVYDTACTDDDFTESCARHPHYATALKNILSPACSRVHGQEVYRGRIGSMQAQPLCDRVPVTTSTCNVRHGTLHNILGQTISTEINNGFMPHANSYRVHSQQQRGMWYFENFLFSANLRAPTQIQKEPISLALEETDIGGHAMHFEVRETGTLVLKHSHETNLGKMDEREYLQFASATANAKTVEQKIGAKALEAWSWLHTFELAKENEDFIESENIGWQCPLWRLSVLHSNRNTHQARTPQRLRNQARFQHITSQNGVPNYYAHVTKQKTSEIIPDMHAAYFISDTIGCTSDRTRCHSLSFLQRSINVQMSHAWNIVQFVPDLNEENMMQECQKTLDWPHI